MTQSSWALTMLGGRPQGAQARLLRAPVAAHALLARCFRHVRPVATFPLAALLIAARASRAPPPVALALAVVCRHGFAPQLHHAPLVQLRLDP